MEATDVLRELRVEGLVRKGRVGGKGGLWEWKEEERKLQSTIPRVPQNLQKKPTKTRGIQIFYFLQRKGMKPTPDNIGDDLWIISFFYVGVNKKALLIY